MNEWTYFYKVRDSTQLLLNIILPPPDWIARISTVECTWLEDVREQKNEMDFNLMNFGNQQHYHHHWCFSLVEKSVTDWMDDWMTVTKSFSDRSDSWLSVVLQSIFGLIKTPNNQLAGDRLFTHIVLFCFHMGAIYTLFSMRRRVRRKKTIS